MAIALAQGLSLLALASGAQAQATAAALVGGSRISRVTVYPGTAVVERSARVAAGSRELVLSCLPGNFDAQSLRLEADAGLRLGPVRINTLPRAQVPACNGGLFDARIQALEDQIATLRAEHESHGLVLDYLKRMLAVSSEAPPPAGAQAVARSGLPATLATLQRSSQDALDRQHKLDRQREALERELQPLIAERDRVARRGDSVRTVAVSLAASREAELRLSYQVPGPSWSPAYRAVLDTAGQTVHIERQAQVIQRTGEDWIGVALRLSTGQPRAGTAGPEPRPWEVFPQPPMAKFRQLDMAVPQALMASPAPAMAGAPEAPEAAEPDFSVQVVEGEFATEFEVPGSIDVGSGDRRVSLSLGESRWPVSLTVRTVPQAEASAWLVAELPRPPGVWPDGPLQLLRGSQLVGQDVWRMAGRDSLSLPFGRDELVRVQVNPGLQSTGTTGFIGSRAERRISQVYAVENRHTTPIRLQVLEASPVASDDQIKVTRQFKPQPQPGDWQDQPGVVAWSQTLAAGQKAQFSADYSISHPKDMPLGERR